MNLEELNENIHKIFNIENIKYIRSQDKITGVKFNLNQSNKDLNYAIIELLNLYIVPVFVLPSDQKNKDVSVRIGNRQETLIVKRYIKQNDAYIESTRLEQQRSSGGFLEKAKNTVKSSIKVVHNLISEKEEIEFIEINKDNLNFQISSNESTEVEIIFAESEINIEHIKSILSCASNFLKLKNHDSIKPMIEIGYNWSVAESQDKLSIYPFFSQRTIRGNIKQQETTVCLITAQNNIILVNDNKSPPKIKCKENEYSLLIFSQSLIDFLLFFNNPSRNGEAQISNLQRIEKIFSEDIEIKSDKEANSSNKAKIKIENATCFTSSLYYKDGILQLKKSGLGEKIHFNFEVRVENDLDQKESKFIYDSTIYKIASLISFFALSFNENKFSISAEVDKKNIFSIKTNSYSELVPTICEKLKEYVTLSIRPKDYTNLNPQHILVLDLFRTQGVSFKLEAEAQKIAINKLKDVKDLISGISILDSCRKEFLDNIGNPLVHCYLSNFFYEGNNLSCVYVITHPKNLSINGELLDKNSAIDFLQNELQKNFDRISNNLKQIQKEENFSIYSIDINIDKLLSQHIDKLQEEATEVTEETEITEEEVKVEPQKYIEYDVDWQEKCFEKIKPANDYTSLELDLKEACKFVHYRVLHVCEQLLKKINTLQLGKEQKVAQDDQLSIDESTIQTTLDDNISNFNKFIDEKVREFEAINLYLDSEQKKIIVNIGRSISDAAQNYQKVVKIHLFINKNANDLQKILKKNIKELEQLMLDVQMNKIGQMIAESSRLTEGSTQPDSTTQQEKSQGQDAELNNTENSSSSPKNSDEQTDCIEENGEVENEVTLEHILKLFNKLSNKLNEWENLDQNSQNQTASNDQKKSIPDLFRNLTSKITRLIKLKEKDADVEQTQTLDQYKQILNLADNIFYSAKILHYRKIQDGFEKLEKEIHNIVGTTHDCLKKELDEQEEELKRRGMQLEQEISVRKIGSEIIVNITRGVVSLCGKAKDKVIDSIGQVQSQSSNVQNAEYSSSLFHNNHYNYNYQQSDFSQANTKYNSEIITNQSNSITIDSTYNHKHSNLQKLKVGIKDAFSEKENYAFFVFITVATAGVLAYFVPEGLRKFVPSEKLNIIDITVAVGVTALIALSVVALAYSVYTNIVHSNMTDPTASSYNAQNLNP